MAQGTDKVHRAGRFGARYGTSVRRRVTNIERAQFDKHRCPQCLTGELKRVSTSVWRCRKCDHKFAGGAYVPRTESFGKAQAPAEELEEVAEELEAELEAEQEEDEAEPVDTVDEAEPEPEPDTAEPSDADEEEAADEEPEDEETRDIGSLFED